MEITQLQECTEKKSASQRKNERMIIIIQLIQYLI